MPPSTCKCGKPSTARKGLCLSCYTKAWYEKHPERKKQRKEYNKKYRLQNIDRLRAYAKTRRERGGDTLRAKQRERVLRWRFGLTPIQYQEIYDHQKGVCAICGSKPSGRRLPVDHNHQTGEIRGLLCFRCNFGIGWFQEDLVKFKKILKYLSKKSKWSKYKVPRVRTDSKSHKIKVGFGDAKKVFPTDIK